MTTYGTDPERRRIRGRAHGGRAPEPPEHGAAAQDAEPDAEQVARTIALRQLSAAPRSRAQLAETMARKDVPGEVAEAVLDRFTEVGLVDDAAYAEMLVRSRQSERGLARRALAQELRRKGIEEDVAAAALEQVDDVSEEEAARALVAKRAQATRGLDPDKRRRRLAGMLARKGYGPGISMRVIAETLSAESEGGDAWADDLDQG